MGLIKSWLARQDADAEEAERVAAMFGYGGLSERERYRKAVRELAEEKVQQAHREAEWTETIVEAVTSQPGAWTKVSLVWEFFHFREGDNCVQATIVDRLISQGVLRVADDGGLWPRSA